MGVDGHHIYLESDCQPLIKCLFQLDDEPNLYMENGWKSPFPSINNSLALEFRVDLRKACVPCDSGLHGKNARFGTTLHALQLQAIQAEHLGNSLRNLGHIPIGSMYGIFTCIYHNNQPNVGKYTIHGSYGI